MKIEEAKKLLEDWSNHIIKVDPNNHEHTCRLMSQLIEAARTVQKAEDIGIKSYVSPVKKDITLPLLEVFQGAPQFGLSIEQVHQILLKNGQEVCENTVSTYIKILEKEGKISQLNTPKKRNRLFALTQGGDPLT